MGAPAVLAIYRLQDDQDVNAADLAEGTVPIWDEDGGPEEEGVFVFVPLAFLEGATVTQRTAGKTVQLTGILSLTNKITLAASVAPISNNVFGFGGTVVSSDPATTDRMFGGNIEVAGAPNGFSYDQVSVYRAALKSHLPVGGNVDVGAIFRGELDIEAGDTWPLVRGLDLSSLVNDGTITLLQGIYIPNVTGLATTPWAIYSAGGPSYHAGVFEAGSLRLGGVTITEWPSGGSGGGFGSAFTLTDAATVTPDAAADNLFDWTIGGNRTLLKPTGGTDAREILIRIRQDAIGGRNLTLGAGWRVDTDTDVSLSDLPGYVDYLRAIYNEADDRWDVLRFSRGFPDAATPTVLFSDDFTAANGTALTARGWAWDASGETGFYQVQSNKAVWTTAEDGYRVTHKDALQADIDMTMDVTGCWDDVNNLSIPVPAFRHSNTSNFWQVLLRDSKCRIQKFIGGVQTTVAEADFVPVTGTTYSMRVVVVGTAVAVYIDDALIVTFASMSQLLTQTTHGFSILKRGSPSQNATVDNVVCVAP